MSWIVGWVSASPGTVLPDCYEGDASLAGEVDWWLAFELWRRAIDTKEKM